MALERGADCLRQPQADPRDWQAWASLVADFGARAQKEELLEALRQEARSATPSPRYEAMVRGVTDRYRPSRVPFMRPLLADKRTRQVPQGEKYRYCDTAVAHLISILNVDLMSDRQGSKREQWDRGAVEAEKWYRQSGLFAGETDEGTDGRPARVTRADQMAPPLLQTMTIRRGGESFSMSAAALSVLRTGRRTSSQVQ